MNKKVALAASLVAVGVVIGNTDIVSTLEFNRLSNKLEKGLSRYTYEKYGDTYNYTDIQKIDTDSGRSYLVTGDYQILVVESGKGYRYYDDRQSSLISKDLKESLSNYGIPLKSLEEKSNRLYENYYDGDNLKDVVNERDTEGNKRVYDIGKITKDRTSDISTILLEHGYKFYVDYVAN